MREGWITSVSIERVDQVKFSFDRFATFIKKMELCFNTENGFSVGDIKQVVWHGSNHTLTSSLILFHPLLILITPCRDERLGDWKRVDLSETSLLSFLEVFGVNKQSFGATS